MSRKKLTVIDPNQPDAEEEDAPTLAELQQEQFNEDSIQKVYDVLRAMDTSGGMVRVKQKKPGSVASGYICRISIEDFLNDGIETLKTEYGGGEFTLTFADSKGKFITQTTVLVDPRFKGRLDTPEPTPDKNGQQESFLKALEEVKSSGNKPDMMPLVLAMITNSNQAIVTMMTKAQETTTTLLGGMMTMIASLAEKKPTDPALLELIKSKTEKTPVSEMIEGMVALKQLGEGQAPEKDDMIEKLVKLAGPPLMNLLLRQAQPQAPAQAQIIPENVPTPAPAAPATAAPRLAPAIPFLVTAARRNSDPQSYYDFIVDNLDDTQFDELITVLKSDTWFETLFGSDPQVTQHRAWFEKLRLVFVTDAPENNADAQSPPLAPTP